MWLEEQFREDTFIVYRVRCLSYPNSIALIKISKNRYKIFKGEYELKSPMTISFLVDLFSLIFAKIAVISDVRFS